MSHGEFAVVPFPDLGFIFSFRFHGFDLF